MPLPEHIGDFFGAPVRTAERPYGKWGQLPILPGKIGSCPHFPLSEASSYGVGKRSVRWQGHVDEPHPPYSPMNRAAIVFMISLVPAKIRVTRMSRQARAMGYSSQ